MATVGDVYRVANHFTMPEQVDAYNIFGLKQTAGTCTDVELVAAIGPWVEAAYAWLLSYIHSTVELQDTRISKMVWSGTEWIVQSILGTIFPTATFTGAGDMLPHAVSPYITFETAAPKRKGKVKLTGFTEFQQADSILTGAASTAMASFASSLRTVLTPGSGQLYYAILCDDGTARTTTAALVRGIVGSQRQRKPGVGI